MGKCSERKMNGRRRFLFVDPMIKIPLIIFEPGQTERKDIDNLTSSIDLLPTLLQYAGQQIPTDLPGQICRASTPNLPTQPDPYSLWMPAKTPITPIFPYDLDDAYRQI